MLISFALSRGSEHRTHLRKISTAVVVLGQPISHTYVQHGRPICGRDHVTRELRLGRVYTRQRVAEVGPPSQTSSSGRDDQRTPTTGPVRHTTHTVSVTGTTSFPHLRSRLPYIDKTSHSSPAFYSRLTEKYCPAESRNEFHPGPLMTTSWRKGGGWGGAFPLSPRGIHTSQRPPGLRGWSWGLFILLTPFIVFGDFTARGQETKGKILWSPLLSSQ